MACSKVSVVLLMSLCGFVLCIVDDCSINTYDNNENHMQFTKEPTVAEFAIVGNFKGLHCCAKGYRSVEWLKDDKKYPWPSAVSGLILYPESANQTIYTQTVTVEDAGNYTCLLRNDTTVTAHTIQLKVFDKAPDHPKLTYVSGDKEVSIGHPLRLFCEAFVGVVDLPDAHSEAIWTKSGHNGSLDDEPGIRQERVSREDGQTFGTYLIIEQITSDDFGKYVCIITKPGRTIERVVYIREKVHVEYLNPNPVPWKKMITWTSILIAVVISFLILNLRFGLSLRVRFKDRFGNVEDLDGKTNDVLIVYAPQDSDIALGKILPKLESQYNYKCATREFPHSLNLWCARLSDISRKSRRIVAVLSPACLDQQWDTSTLYQALKQLNSLEAQLVCVILQEAPKTSAELKNSQGESLGSMLRTTTVIAYGGEDSKFWLSLRLRLPAKRGLDVDEMILTQSNNSNTRLNTYSQDSLDVLV